MRIGLVSQEYPPETAHGGIGSQTYLKAHGLASRGHEVHVISHSPDHDRHDYQDGMVHIIRIPGFDERLPLYTEPARWLTYSAEVAAAVAALHERAPLDLVDFPEWGGEGYVHLLNRTEWNHIPTVIHLHGPLIMFAHTMGWPELDSEFYCVGTMMEATCLRLADAVFASGGPSANWCAEHYNLRREHIPILHLGVDTDLFRPHEVPKASRPTIVFVGKIARNKGVELLLEASSRLAGEYPDLQLRLIGRGDTDLAEELQARARADGLPDLLDLLGFVDRQALPKYLSRAHIFAAPSIYEGGPGLVYLEAMACGLPVIACAGSGAAEVVIPEENGLLVPANDSDALMQALRRLLADVKVREEIGKRARDYVLREANSKSCVARLEAFYKTVADDRRRKSDHDED